MESDPYASPTTKAIKAFVSSEGAESSARLRDIVFSWEKLRIIYNLILVGPGLAVLYYSAISSSWSIPLSEIFYSAIPFAILANLCFFAGPLAELYFSAIWQLSNSRAIRYWCFGLGLAFSLLIMLMSFWAI